jgi:hypothetical protein
MSPRGRVPTRAALPCGGGGMKLPNIPPDASSYRCPKCKKEISVERPTPEAIAEGYVPTLARHHRGVTASRGPASRSTRKS